MKVVGGWEFELEKREVTKIVDVNNGRRPYLIMALMTILSTNPN